MEPELLHDQENKNVDGALVYALSALNIGPLSSKRFSPNSCTVFVVVGVKGCVHGMCLNDGDFRRDFKTI